MMPRTAVLACLCLLLAACGINARRFPPQYETPATRANAAKMLHGALVRAEALANVQATEYELRWDEVVAPFSDAEPSPRTVVTHTLVFSQLRGATRPVQSGGRWRVDVSARGGNLTFFFANADDAARAEAGLRKLSRQDAGR